MVNAQEWLDREYTNKRKIGEIKANNNELESSLKIIDWPNLKKLRCEKNKLTNLILENLPELTNIWCKSNKLTNLVIINCPKLIGLSASGNSLTSLAFHANKLKSLAIGKNLVKDLATFSKFINLEKLYINNNPLCGSLEPLKSLTNLRELVVSNTNIDNGLECLPRNLERIGCKNCPKLEEKFKDYSDSKVKVGYYEYYNFLTWRKDKELSGIEQNIVKPTLKHFIGKGGYGEVHYGEWKLQKVAVKKPFLSLSNTSESDLIKDIQREINILKNLRNRYIIQYYGVYSDDHEILIIMDYAENGTLTKFINNSKNKEHDWNFNNEIIRQITSGLAYIHQEKIIHRDLKSMNILLTKNYEVKISDFGLSKVKNISSSYSKDEAKGTLGWMAPELLKDLNNPKYSEQSDIYALGMIMWEISAKSTVPFKDISDVLVILRILDNKIEDIPENTPKDIQKIIQECWRTDPSKRITLEDILKTIENSKLGYNYHSLSDISKPKPQESQKNSESWYTESTCTDASSATPEFSQDIFDIVSSNSSERKLVTRTKRHLPFGSQTAISQTKTKSPKIMEKTIYQTEPMEIDKVSNQNWTNIHSNFTLSLIQLWTNHNFTCEQTRDWINIYSPADREQAIQEPAYYAWLRDIKQLEPEEVLNYGNREKLRTEYQEYQQQKFQTNIQIPPK